MDVVVLYFIIFSLAQALLDINVFLPDFKGTDEAHINSSHNHGAINFELSGYSDGTKDYILVQV